MSAERKAAFNAVKRIYPDIWNGAGNVQAFDAIIDSVERPHGGYKLGSLSERYESGGRGPGTVSSGVGDPGGVSYGLYQLASKTGTCAAFISEEGKRWAAEFGAAQPGSTAFSAAWKAVAGQEPEEFGAAQHAFIERTHYRPVVEKVKASTGLDLDSRHNAIRDATWSCAVQHGGAATILTDAVRATELITARQEAVYDSRLLDAIYNRRSAYVRGVAARSSGAAAKTLLSVVENRYPAELARAKAMLA